MNQINTITANHVETILLSTDYKFKRLEANTYVSFDLRDSYGIYGDFFVRAQSVGVTFKGEDKPLFTLLMSMVKDGTLKFTRQVNGEEVEFEPYYAGKNHMDSHSIKDGNFSVVYTPGLDFYLAGISSGNLKGVCDIELSTNPETFDRRGKFLARLLVNQWIIPMMPHIETYSRYKRLGLLKTTEV